MFLIVGIAGIAINREKDRATQWDAGENPTYVVEMSIGNHGKSTEYYRRSPIIIELVLNIIFILVILIGSIILRRLQNKVINEIDEKNLTPSDFGVMVTHLPVNKNEEEVKAWFREFFPQMEIVYVNF